MDLGSCGDGERRGTEECDGIDLGIYDNGDGMCDDYDSDYVAGDLSCDASCAIDGSGCVGDLILYMPFDEDGDMSDHSGNGYAHCGNLYHAGDPDCPGTGADRNRSVSRPSVH